MTATPTLTSVSPTSCYQTALSQNSQCPLVTYSDLDSVPELNGGPLPTPSPSVLHIEADGLIIPSFSPSLTPEIGYDILAAPIIRATAPVEALGFDVNKEGSQGDAPISPATLSSPTAPAAPAIGGRDSLGGVPADAALNNPASPDAISSTLTTTIPLVPRTPQEVESTVAGLPEDGWWYTVTHGRRPGVYPNMYAPSHTFKSSTDCPFTGCRLARRFTASHSTPALV